VTSDTPLDRAIRFLTNAGYRRLPTPLVVGNIPFQFAGVLLGSGYAPDLVVVVDTIEEPASRVKQKMVALSRALDVVGSKRPLTAVLVGPRPTTPVLETLGRVCRVLPIGTPLGDAAEAELRDWLAVLTPLHLPAASDAVADPLGELMRHLPHGMDPVLRDQLLTAARQSAQSVGMSQWLLKFKSGGSSLLV
jgi:hypothetical protein